MIKNGDLENKVSIIVPVYNAEEYLKKCLDSILRQTFGDWICYLVNDGSTDDSQSIIEEYCQVDDRFVGLTKQNEGSPAKTIRYAFKYIESEFIIAIGNDDAISDDYVEKLLNRQKGTNADLVIPYMVFMDESLRDEKFRLPNYQFDIQQVMWGGAGLLVNYSRI